MNTDGGLDFEAVLEHELRRWVGHRPGSSPTARQAAYRRALATGGRRTMPLVPCLVAAAALALCGGSAAAAAAATHGTDPVTWAETVTDAVVSCRTQLGGGRHGIGECVSEVARKHGAARREIHSQAGPHEQGEATPSPRPTEEDEPQPTPSGRRVGNPNGRAPTAIPSSPAASPSSPGHTHPTGRPSARPSPGPHHTPDGRA